MEALVQIKTAKISPLYLIEEEEQYFMTEFVKILLERVVQKGLEAFNYTRMSLDKITNEQLCEALSALPMFSDIRLLVLENAEKIKQPLIETLTPFLENPESSLCLVVLNNGTLPAKSLLKKLIAKNGQVISFTRPSTYQLPGFIKSLVRAKGKKIDDEAVLFFSELIGNDVPRLNSEIDKTILYIGEKEVIAVDDVEQINSELKLTNVFDLLNALGMRKANVALAMMSRLLTLGTPHLLILSMLNRHFREIIHARMLAKKGVSRSEIVATLGIKPFLVDRFFSGLQQFSGRKLAKIYRRIAELDLIFKSSPADKDLLLHCLVLDILRPE